MTDYAQRIPLKPDILVTWERKTDEPTWQLYLPDSWPIPRVGEMWQTRDSIRPVKAIVHALHMQQITVILGDPVDME